MSHGLSREELQRAKVFRVRSSGDVLDLDADRVQATVVERDLLLAALLAVSPWKLNDCWCVEADHGGSKPHSEACQKARAAVKRVRGG